MANQEMINEALAALDIARDELTIALFLELEAQDASDLVDEKVVEAAGMIEQALAILQGQRIDQ